MRQTAAVNTTAADHQQHQKKCRLAPCILILHRSLRVRVVLALARSRSTGTRNAAGAGVRTPRRSKNAALYICRQKYVRVRITRRHDTLDTKTGGMTNRYQYDVFPAIFGCARYCCRSLFTTESVHMLSVYICWLGAPVDQ